MARADGPHGIVTMVCETCGNALNFETRVPDDLRCNKCGGVVFREFDTPTEPDEATLAQLEEQARSMSYGEASPQSAPDDIRDLDNP